ncbi:RNA polymerase sigma-70 factor (ECF subfamily) [Pontibacter ummariensis]|uniref:RNA polymerase sigma-70 factor, ECF subfamily n=1 Tax=Pontibacter ummariensis TaxID=1610492 RepID=A0A239HC26_9BACT|nr:RNA polymerase sigma factor [Pontibacter ummariensis]PRY10702.1 RNA polymerase sigma-70 factor (ECF subfamily) [Pontibacter ummariensis]SNS77814.1 RNA polymerase sigma-70 factor, ECF subfamily [Pontibacter ummariensis]
MKLFTKPKSDEEKLIEGCIAGKREMQRLLYDLYAKKMMMVCLRYAPTTFEAEDIMQDAFVKVFANIANFKRDCPLEFWIRRIMVNTALKHLRGKQLLTVSHEAEEVGNLSAEDYSLSGYSMDELLGMIQSLAPRYRMVFNLYAIEGYNHKEIGEMLGISEGTSKSQYSRARAILQSMLTRQENNYQEHVISS